MSAPTHSHAAGEHHLRSTDLRNFVHGCCIRDLEMLREMIATELETFAQSQVVSVAASQSALGWEDKDGCLDQVYLTLRPAHAPEDGMLPTPQLICVSRNMDRGSKAALRVFVDAAQADVQYKPYRVVIDNETVDGEERARITHFRKA